MSDSVWPGSSLAMDEDGGGGHADEENDLGLAGSLSAEDIKWMDLEFLDLASGPPAMPNQERNKSKNPTLA